MTGAYADWAQGDEVADAVTATAAEIDGEVRQSPAEARGRLFAAQSPRHPAEVANAVHGAPRGRTYYELHVTVGTPRDASASDALKTLVKQCGWKYSQIDGDPVTGPGVKSYATTHMNAKYPVTGVKAHLHEVADSIANAGFDVTRRKVELVIYDDRSSKVGSCDGACPECHRDEAP